MLNKNDVKIIRKLAGQVAEIAALPVQEEKRAMWRKLNGLQPVRPMVMIDQICWNELAPTGELTLECTDEECRGYETDLRRTLYRWKHFPVDRVVESFVRVPKAINNPVLGMKIVEETAVSDPDNSVKGHKYENQFQTEEDLDKIKMPTVSHNASETARRVAVAHELFDGLLEVREWGWEPYLSLWDPIATWMGVENALYAIVDQPEYMHRLLKRMVDGYLSMLDQLEEQGLLCGPQSLIHCTGAFTDELPASGYNPEKPRTKDIWMYGLAQMLGSVSPDMYEEFEVEHSKRICERFGMVYYGCCEPLDGKMDQVRRIPNARKVSMSPWANQERGAAEIRNTYVFSRKPNPALLAKERFHADEIREDLMTTRRTCEKHGCPLEFIQKDISTVGYDPKRLDEWSRIAMEVAGA